MKHFRLPPHVAWPAFILALFGAGTISTLSMVWIARLDGGAQVVDDYYKKAVEWDQTAARRSASAALRWNVTLEPGSLDPQTGLRKTTFTVVDSASRPVPGLAGTVGLFRPQLANTVAAETFSELETRPGAYVVYLPMNRRGLWDIEIHADLDSVGFWHRVRKEIQ